MQLMENWLAMRQLERQIQRDVQALLDQAPYKVSLNEFYTLYYLEQSQEQELQISQLSEKIGLSISATSRMLVSFEETCGVIERRPCADDKRGVRIALTAAGKELLAEARQAMNPILEQYQDQLQAFDKNK